MSAARTNLAARAAAVTSHAAGGAPPAADTSPPVATARPAPARAPRTRPVRITVDLAPVDHRRLKRWCDDAAEHVGSATVPAADVVRVLLARLHTDPDLAAQVIADLRSRGD